MPSDDKQWESMSAGHLLFLILDSQRENSLFRSRLAKNAQNVIDLGTGNGEWALAVADKFPNREYSLMGYEGGALNEAVTD